LIGKGLNSAQFSAIVQGESTNDYKSSSRTNEINNSGLAPKSDSWHWNQKCIGVKFLK